jgi:hypothetical protein
MWTALHAQSAGQKKKLLVAAAWPVAHIAKSNLQSTPATMLPFDRVTLAAHALGASRQSLCEAKQYSPAALGTAPAGVPDSQK